MEKAALRRAVVRGAGDRSADNHDGERSVYEPFPLVTYASSWIKKGRTGAVTPNIAPSTHLCQVIG